ncbi:HAD-IIB family hydrolase [Acidipropionibacterium jensenii]|uniref:phosphomannomutase n=1 Tax=Acidipropionibacterium jensenii TaxID=1749 RepID=A0A3S4V969_9ACTN|nr:HAD-IIB family hydrolase [Acidipropionibacterium jensenii]MDN5977321.1 HAD-IIB family hydrolase [Acidipropionibacterium jensenii]MDN5996265.1 HAD-IIB family hydrolase [Acidipropionibacterium jensenii]MDN6426978.1 HAD-IIB family hydrolase [Acidipropionibacterium jensenii]MDN6441474.1 HAD-IIB family hydrolase [Acidipropionibacterium jensenii]MDN6480165.1 HAD-IIB family hydrolase [Acidipropionibacterium jensenii]
MVAFDLDDTLAPSKTRLPEPMAETLARLLEATQVCVVSGGQFGQFRSQVVEPLDEVGSARMDRLHLMPACGTQYYRLVDGRWDRIYLEALTDDEKSRATEALEGCARRLGLWEEHTWGPTMEDRESQITFSALGQEAPVPAKRAWDPTGEKKLRLRAAVAELLPDLEVRAGGSTSVDITRVGRDKSFGIGELLTKTGLNREDLLFFGDRLDVNGNDYPVKAMGVPCVSVTGWQDTVEKLEALLAEAAGAGLHQSA